MFVSAGKLVLDFYNNDSLAEKQKQMMALLKDIHRKFNVSAIEAADFEELERCVIGLALVAGNEKTARAAMKKVLEYIDTTAFARVMTEDTDVFGYD